MTPLEVTLLLIAGAYGAGCVWLNGQRLRWREEANRLREGR